MHKLHTTGAFVLQRYPQGESNFTYKLLTHTLGLLYAHGQGVRELKSRNKYALQVGQLSDVTLVKGREVWRITGARTSDSCDFYKTSIQSEYKRKILSLVGTMLPVEDDSRNVFEIVRTCFCFEDSNHEETKVLVEAVTLLRLMDELGYVARPLAESSIKTFLDSKEINDDILELAEKHRRTLIARVNSALEGAK